MLLGLAAIVVGGNAYLSSGLAAFAVAAVTVGWAMRRNGSPDRSDEYPQDRDDDRSEREKQREKEMEGEKARALGESL
ncbi:hypothetical protein G9464_04280 [Halostella sp. JP-L12]|uniref:hypothetical protein n=1 Tax=Halostella TaxID=1843185 RepID=UPI000EF78A43|nr:MULTISPECIES: hypothetical protein [Halostella]NHN46814.1 hypothetical protein [Halostella sp. JP-L12]